MMRDLNLNDLRRANLTRCEGAFHDIDAWSPTDWACALAGEVGELCNLIKKLRRLTGPTMESGRANTPDMNELLRGIGEELADSIIYADLLAARLEIDLAQAVMDKFNKVSARVGSHIRLGE